MGDTGSLALGGMLGAIAVAVKHEIVLAVIGGLFVLEAVSVIVQVVSFKLTGKRVFRMAPLHHHFEQKGWTEPQIVIRFWIISVMLALAGLSTLKLRCIMEAHWNPIRVWCGAHGRGAPFAGKTVAVFGLGGSGLASCHALKAGGAEVIAGDDGVDRLVEAAQAGFTTADLRKVSWANFAALVLTPGAPLTHPAPHWSVLAAREAGVEVIGDIELFCRERRRHAPDAPFVAITGTNGKSTTTALIAHLMRFAGYDTQMGGNIGTAILSLEPPRMGRVHVIEMSSYQIDLAPSLDPSVGILLNISEDHIDRHGTLEHYAAVKERLVAGVQKQGTAIVGVDDGWSRNTADRIEQAGRRVVRISVKNPLPDGVYVERETIWRAAGGARTRSRGSAASDPCAACTMRRMRPALRLARWRWVSQPKPCKTACAAFPASPIAWSRSAAAATCCSSTTPRAPMPMRRRMRCRPLPIFSGLPAASRSSAASPA